MQGLLCVLSIPFFVIIIIVAMLVDVSLPLNQLGMIIFSVIYWIAGVIISIFVCVKLEKEKWRARKKQKEELNST